jgi:molybdenum cofactor biosynthesis protein B
MGYDEHKYLSPSTVICAVLIISDSRDEKTDESGKLLVDGIKSVGHTVSSCNFLKNDAVAIQLKLNELLADSSLQVIITSGGTGLSHLDLTVEAVTPLLQKKMDGFGELFRHLTYQEIGTGSILSRAVAGISQGKVVICLPGSVKAVKLALEKIILSEIGHMVREAAR